MKWNRRSFVAVLPVFALGLVGRSRLLASDSLPLVDPKKDQLAVTLGYYEDVKNIDMSKWGKRYQPGQVCRNCQLYTNPSKDPGPCTLFVGKAVKAEGWCSGWVKRVS